MLVYNVEENMYQNGYIKVQKYELKWQTFLNYFHQMHICLNFFLSLSRVMSVDLVTDIFKV